MGRVARLPVTVCLFAGFTIADIPHPLDHPAGIVFTRVCLPAGGESEPCSTMAAKDISRQEGLPANVAGNSAFLFGSVGPVCADALSGLK